MIAEDAAPTAVAVGAMARLVTVGAFTAHLSGRPRIYLRPIRRSTMFSMLCRRRATCADRATPSAVPAGPSRSRTAPSLVPPPR